MQLFLTLCLLVGLMVTLYLVLVVFVQTVPNVMPYGAMVLLMVGQSGLMYNVIQVGWGERDDFENKGGNEDGNGDFCWTFEGYKVE